MQRRIALDAKPSHGSYRLAILVELARIAAEEGCTLDDLIFEAIEEYVKTRASQSGLRRVQQSRPHAG